MIDVRDIEEIVASFIQEHEGYFLVRAEVKGFDRIEIEVDHDSEPVDIDTIVALTRYIEARLDRDKEDYELEVSSAGLTTPLVGERRYRKFVGKELEVLLTKGMKEVGTLTSVSPEGIVLEVARMEKAEGERRKRKVLHRLSIGFDEIKRATYLLKV